VCDRHHRGGVSPSSRRVRSHFRSSSAWSTTSCWSRRAISSNAICCLLEIEKTVVEGAGAAGLAAIDPLSRSLRRQTGRADSLRRNIDPMMLAESIERGMVRAGRLVRLRVATRDVPGELARVATIVEPRAPISRRSSTSALSPRCRCRTRSSRWCFRRAVRSTSKRCSALYIRPGCPPRSIRTEKKEPRLASGFRRGLLLCCGYR